MSVNNNEDLALLKSQIKDKKLQFTSAIRQNAGFAQAKVYLFELHILEDQLRQYDKNNSVT